MARIMAGFILATALAAGGLLYYLQVYAYYGKVPSDRLEAVRLTPLIGETPEEIPWDKLEAISGENKPIRFRACFETTLSQAMATETYIVYDAAEPLHGPGWFDCFDAKTLGADLATGHAIAFLGEANITYGVDRIVALYGDGRGYIWHQLNDCGTAVFGGKPLPESCPEAPNAE